MDSFHNQQQQQQNPWFPSSSPPPPPNGNYYNHPPPQQNQPPPHQWGPPPPHPYHHHPIPNHPPPPYLHQPPPPSYAPAHHPHHPHHPHHQYPLPPPLPPRPIPPPHSGFPPPPNQPWGAPTWPQHHGYPERINPYNNEEDWAARAKAWASAETVPENHHVQSHFTSVGRMDEQHSYAYRDQYQQAVGPPGDAKQPSPFLQSSNQQLPVNVTDPLKQVNHLYGSSSFSSGSSSYGTGYNAGDETFTTTTSGPSASPPKNYAPSSSIYEQEVSYSYSSAPGNREAVHQSGSHIPLPLHSSSVQEGNHSHSMLPSQMISPEAPHFSHHSQPTEFLPDASDRPLEFASRYDSEPKISYSHGAVMDHNPTPSSLHAWTSSTASGVGFPQMPLGSATTQFDPTSVHPSPAFGGIPVPGFQPSVPPVSAPFGLGPGVVFPGDVSIERPKKAAVPNWLREEIIKKKSVIPSSIPAAQPTGNTSDSFGSEDGDKSFRRAEDQADSKSIDSTRSTEDEEDDEDVEEARTAAINQEIKRVLTEVLLKVTDELFDEIATRVVNEDEPIVAVEKSTVIKNQKASPPPAIPAPQASAKVLVPVKPETKKENSVGENSSMNSSGKNLLGLANYASDDDGDDQNEIYSSKLPSSGKKEIASHQQDNNSRSSTNYLKSEKNGSNIDGMAEKYRAQTENGSPAVNNSYNPDEASERILTVSEELAAFQSNDTIGEKDGKRPESTSYHANNDKLLTKDYRERESKKLLGTDKNAKNRSDDKTTKKTSRETSDASDSIIHEEKNKLKDKRDKRDKLERSDDRSSARRSHGKESDSRSAKHNSIDRKKSTEARREKNKGDGERRRGRGREDKEDLSTSATKDSSRYNSRRSPSPKGRSKRDNSFSHGSASGDEPSDSSKRRKQQSLNSSLSPSPTKSRKRQISRSPPSKHSHRRHSPYSSIEKRRKSRSISPAHRRSSTRK